MEKQRHVPTVLKEYDVLVRRMEQLLTESSTRIRLDLCVSPLGMYIKRGDWPEVMESERYPRLPLNAVMVYSVEKQTDGDIYRSEYYNKWRLQSWLYSQSKKLQQVARPLNTRVKIDRTLIDSKLSSLQTLIRDEASPKQALVIIDDIMKHLRSVQTELKREIAVKGPSPK